MTKMTIAASHAAEFDAARDAVTSLQAQRTKLEDAEPARLRAIDEVAYAALIDNDATAKKRLEELHAAAGRAGSQIAAVDRALVEARRRQTAAERKIRAAEIAENADEVLGHADDMVTEAAAFDEAVKSLAVATEKFLAAHRKTIALGVDTRGIPNLMTVDLFLKRAIASYPVLQLMLRTGVDLAPAASRITASEVAKHWRSEYQSWADPRLAGTVVDDEPGLDAVQ